MTVRTWLVRSPARVRNCWSWALRFTAVRKRPSCTRRTPEVAPLAVPALLQHHGVPTRGAQPLTRSALEPEPFLTVDFGGQRPPFTVTHTGTLPAGKSGRHLIYGVWDIADTGNAFYSCADVTFG